MGRPVCFCPQAQAAPAFIPVWIGGSRLRDIQAHRKASNLID
jgi:hypothetical protein